MRRAADCLRLAAERGAADYGSCAAVSSSTRGCLGGSALLASTGKAAGLARTQHSSLQQRLLALATGRALGRPAANAAAAAAAAAAAVQRAAGAAAVQRAASAAGAGCSGRSIAGSSAAVLLAAGRRGVHTAPATWQPLALQLLARGSGVGKPCLRLKASYGTHVPTSSSRAAGSGKRPSKWATVRRQLATQTEWVLGRGYRAREAFCNAVYTQPVWSKSLLLLLAERVSRGDPSLAWCYSTPVAESEEQLFEQAEVEPAFLSRLQRARRAAASLARLAVLLLLFSPVVLSAPFVGDFLGLSRATWLRLLRRTLEIAGPAFIKWGQWAATRHDLFPPDFCSELELLHCQAPAHALPFTEAAVRESFGFGVTHLFSQFDSQPVASGSIGQIHRGLLSETGARLTGMEVGTVVAVKVRHPGVSESIERDFALMMAAARVCAHLPALRELRLEESLKQFAAPLREQVDLAREATHLHAFNYNFRKIAGVSFPVPLYPLVQPAVLVETFEAGQHISAYVARGAGAPHNSELAKLGARTMLHMMLVDNLIHADLHPGNVLVTLDLPFGRPLNALVRAGARAASSLFGWDSSALLESWRRASLVLLDAGMAMRLSPEDQRNMFGLFESFAEMDGSRVADWALRFSGEEQSCPDPEAFRADVATFFERLTAESVSSGATHGADALADVLEMVRTHNVNMPGHICATVVTTMVLEGWSNKLDPEHSTLQEVRRMVSAAKGGLLGQLTEIMLRGELAADSEVMERVSLLEPALMKI